MMGLKTEIPILYWSEGDEKKKYYTVFDNATSAIDEFLSKDKEDIHNFSWTPQNASNVYVYCDEVISHRLILTKVPFRYFSKTIENLENKGYVEQKGADIMGENQLYVAISLDKSNQYSIRTQIQVFADIDQAFFEYESLNKYASFRCFTPPENPISYEEAIDTLNNGDPLYGSACKLVPVSYYKFSDYFKSLESNIYSIFNDELI